MARDAAIHGRDRACALVPPHLSVRDDLTRTSVCGEGPQHDVVAGIVSVHLASIWHEMDIPERVEAYLAGQPEPKQSDLRRLHAHVLAEFPECRLWFDDGTKEDGKVVANPNIGYGAYTITYANGSSREFYRIGLSANTTGISVYVLGLDDKTYLTRTYGASIGKARVTGYCIRFTRLAAINSEALHAAIRHGMTLGP